MWDQELNKELHDDHIWTYMEAGNELCRRWERGDALALLATAKINQYRADVGFPDTPLHRTAYVLRSLKRPMEVTFLRGVYGSRFILIGAYSPRDDRLKALVDGISKSHQDADPKAWHYSPEKLIERDEAENIPGGQNVRDTYHRADVFVDTRNGVQAALDRVFRGLFGDPEITPTKDEFALFQAEAAGLRSAELGRQVGAAIANQSGQVLAVGANEVPRWGGGSYWTGDKDDAREITKGSDTNDVMKQELAAAIAEQLNQKGWIKAGWFKKASLAEVIDEISETRLGDLIEFGRATHAEMAAITDAARVGISIAGTTLYTTSFPCHNCTRHIISSGITRVVYVAPYAKSLARRLHDDAIIVAAATPALDKVNFEPFVGIAPVRYMDVFQWHRKRKNPDGTRLEFDPKTATARLSDVDPDELVGDRPPYVVREALVQKLVSFTEEKSGLRLDVGPEEDESKTE